MSIYGSLLEHTNLISLSEAYIGKTDTLLEMEDAIGKIRETALRKFTDINKSPEVLAFNRLMEKQFGMDCYALYIDQSNVINAYTKVVGARFDIALKDNISDWVEGDRVGGYRWKDGNRLCIMACIYMGLLGNPNFTNEEILAVLLHELGHNFADAIYDDIKIANQKMMEEVKIYLIIESIISFGLLLPASIATYIENLNKTERRKGKTKHKNIFRGISEGLKGMRTNFDMFWNSVFARIKGGSAYERYKMILDARGYKQAARKSLGRQNEVIADKFAGIYGYGPAQVSALFKMDKIESKAEQFVKKIPLIGESNNDSFNAAIVDLTDYDVHPHNIQRANEEIALLKKELERTDIDPKLKKMMTEQINQIQNILKEETKVIQDGSKSAKAREAYYAYINGECPMAVDEEIEDKIEEALNKALEENKK